MMAFDPIARGIVAALLLGVLGAGAFALAVIVASRVWRQTATTRHVLWWIVLCSTVVLPTATSLVSLQRIQHRAAVVADAPAIERAEPTFERAARASTASSHVRGASRKPASRPARATAMTANPGTAAPSMTTLARDVFYAPGVATALLVLWLVVAAIRLASLGFGLHALLRIKRIASVLDESIARRLRRHRNTMRTSRNALLLVSADVDVPVAVGFGRPAIILPLSVVENETIADIDQVVMHEHAHLDRYDDLTNFLQCIVERVFWFNPIASLAGRRIALEREIACDDAVVAHTGRAHRYASCLWKLVEATRLPVRPLVAPGALGGPRQITQRIERLLDANRNALPRLSPVTAFVLGALVCAGIFVQAQHAPAISIADALPLPGSVPETRSARILDVANAAPPSSHVAYAPLPPDTLANVSVARAAALSATPTIAPVAAPPASPASPASAATPDASAAAWPDFSASIAGFQRSIDELAHTSMIDRRAYDQIERDLARAQREMREATTHGAYDADVQRQIERAMTAAEAQVRSSLREAEVQRLAATQTESERRAAEREVIADAGGGATGGVHRSLSNFDRVESDGSSDIVVRSGSPASVDFQGDGDLAAHTQTSVSNGRLVISQTGSLEGHHPPIIVTTARLTGVSVQGSSNIDVPVVAAHSFDIEIAGSGDVRAAGTAREINVTIEGSGEADLRNLSTRTANVQSHGSGSVTLRAPDTLNASIDGSGNLNLIGKPKHSSTQVEGSGSITQS